MTKQHLSLTSSNNQQLKNLCGEQEKHLKQLEKTLRISIIRHGHDFHIEGETEAAQLATICLQKLFDIAADEEITSALIHHTLKEFSHPGDSDKSQTTILKTKHSAIKARSQNQQHYVAGIHQAPINFGIGPAGTGKTYLAVACAVAALQDQKVERILLVRPVVEAGERLGFLPGDLMQKVDPYFKPLYDALYDMMGFENVGKLLQKNIIEIAPLAYMRGRTLNDAFIILDEGQNTTREQMKMFLTRVGFGSTVVVTGDLTQVDLPKNIPSGLKQALEILTQVEGVAVTHFTSRDVVRHPIVQAIVEAYAAAEERA